MRGRIVNGLGGVLGAAAGLWLGAALTAALTAAVTAALTTAAAADGGAAGAGAGGITASGPVARSGAGSGVGAALRLDRREGARTGFVTLEHEGTERRAIIDAAPGVTGAPVLVALHGGLAGPERVRSIARVGLADEGWVVLWPYALGDWNDGRTDPDGRPFDTADDIGFLRRLIGGLAARGTIDPERVYFAGPSIGGMMVLRLLCDAPDLVAGAAVAIASLPEGAGCPDGPPVPTLFLHGTDDTIVPPGGGRIGGWNPLIRERGWVRPVSETLALLAARNGCEGARESPLPDRDPDDASRVVLRVYEGCEAPLVHYVVEGGGHTWPGSRRSGLGRRIVGETNRDISATRVIEDFFRGLAAR